MFVMGMGGKIQLLVVPGVVVTKDEGSRHAHVLVSVHQSVNDQLGIDHLAKVQHRAIDEVEFATNEALGRAPLVIRDV